MANPSEEAPPVHRGPSALGTAAWAAAFFAAIAMVPQVGAGSQFIIYCSFVSPGDVADRPSPNKDCTRLCLGFEDDHIEVRYSTSQGVTVWFPAVGPSDEPFNVLGIGPGTELVGLRQGGCP